MRNLRHTRHDRWTPPAQFEGRPLTASTWDLSNDSVLCTFGPTESDPVIELVRVNIDSKFRDYSVITSWDAPCPNPDLPCDKVLSLHYFGDSSTTCLVLAGGDIVVIREEPLPGEDRIEIIGSVDAGITAARWSPDEELLAITTKADTVVFMSRSFEGVTDVAMTSEDLKASNHVSVGWGKKETQFQGRGAKALKDPTMPEKIDEGVLSPNDDHRVSISWRGDGSFLAVSTIESGSRRIIRVYSREGVLDSVSEPVDGLEGALSWRPAGNLIAGIQRFSERVDVVFFERNGLRHGQFSLRLDADQLQAPEQHIRLLWNSDSTVLAVVLSDCIQLWTMGNYYWYLKHEIESGNLLSVAPLLWHPEKSLRFIASASDGPTLVEYIFETARGSTAPPQDYGAVAVIDGKNVKITPFRAANMPPPMALHEIEVPSHSVDVAFNADSSLLAILHRQGISLFEWKDAMLLSSLPSLTGRVTFAKTEDEQFTHQQICFSGADNLLVLKSSAFGSVVERYGFNDETGKIEITSSDEFTSSPVLSISSSFYDGLSYPYAQDTSSALLSLTPAYHQLSDCKFPTYLPWVDIAYSPQPIAFGLSGNGHLYADSRLLVKNCTSFLLTPAHLILTTTNHLLKFVHITDVKDLEVPPDDPEKDERCRSIERGARLVTAMPTSLSLVLQMPRGNLETIFPRAMVLAGIRKLIDEKNYKRAFTHCRTQRVDMNILYDHAPEQFLANLPLFIDQVKKITYLDLFLSSLREEDVTKTMYKETRVLPVQANGVHFADTLNPKSLLDSSSGKTLKVNRICDSFLEVLKSRTSTNLQNIVTANVCKSPPALEDGLQVVAHLMNENSQMADKAVEHICFLADVNKLYDNALGLYNLDLALLVAQQSQKDPREYLPFMQSLQEMTELCRRFSIDDHLGRHTKALSHLHELDAFSELQTYTQKHSLYQYALSLYRYNPSQHSILTILYAQFLESKSSFKEAALAYESLLNYEKATSCYLSSGPSSWRETLFCALSQTPPISGPALTTLATTLYEALTESKDYFAAATIQLDYLSSIPSACRSFCKGYFFADAFHLIAKSQQPELLEQVIDPCLGDALASSTELLSDFKAQLHAQIPRIFELREKALNDPLAFYEGERGGTAEGDLPDDVSVAASSRLSTNRSLFTRYTGKGGSVGTAGTGVSRATSKNRRREERKRARGKKGSVYEEEYLVNSVRRLIERVESVRGEVKRLIEGLVRRGMWERARAVENTLMELLDMCRECVPRVFGTEEEKKVGGGEVVGEEEEYRVTGADAVLQESVDERGKKKEAPVIAPFEKLALLGA